MAERFDDWSPASVFGATSPPQTRRQSSEKDHLTQRECKPRSETARWLDAEQGCSAHLLLEQTKQELSMHTLGREGKQDEHTGSINPHLRYRTRQRNRSTQQEDSKYQEDGNEDVHDEHLVRSKSRIIRRNSDHRMRRDDTRGNRSTRRGSADLIASKERQFAANFIQKHVRVFILRKRERDSLQQVDALRRVLTEAAGQLLIESFRRYRSRLAISNYLCNWWEQEVQIKALLERVRTKKQSRAALLAPERRSTDAQAHYRTRCAKLIWNWYAGQSLLRKCREQIAIQLVAQRQLTCWFRRLCLEQRCRARRQHNQQMCIASQKLQRFVRNVISKQRGQSIRQLQAGSTITVFLQHVVARKQQRIQDLEYKSRLCIAQFYQQRVIIRRARMKLWRRRQVLTGGAILSEYLSKQELQRAFRHWGLQCAELRQQERLRLNASAKVLQRLFRAIVIAARLRRRRESAIRIQTAFQGCRARKYAHELRRRRRKEAKRQKQHTAAIRIQAYWRGYLARWKFVAFLKRMRDRFRCINCGVIEPSGVYCKLCGRKRTNFELLAPVGPYAITLGSFPHKPTKSTAPTIACVPVRPTSPSPFTTLQARKNGAIRRISGRTAAVKSNNQIEQTTPQIPVLASLHVTLSPRQRKDPYPRKRAPRSFNQLTQHGSSNTRPELLQPPVQSQSDRAIVAGDATKLRAQELAKYQALREHKGQSQALAQHLHRLQNTNQVLSRSR